MISGLDGDNDHWLRHALQWDKIGQPLRPGPDDIAIMRRLIATHAAGGGREGVLLGMTDELWQLGSMTGVDRDPLMIRRRRSTGDAVVREVQSDWKQLPFADATFDFAAGDGSLNTLLWPIEYGRVLEQIGAVLRVDGLGVLRVFTRPEQSDTPAEVIEHARNGRHGTFHAFKWRLAMALCAQRHDANIRVGTIFDAFERMTGARSEFSECTGWPVALLDTIDVYRNSEMTYSFPTLRELRATFSGRCRELDVGYGSYELAEQCPVIALGFNAYGR